MSFCSRIHTEFQPQTSWNRFLQKQKSPFELYGEYLDFSHVLHRYMKTENRVLIVGNSKLSEDLYDIGCTNLETIDISAALIKRLSAKNHSKRPQMRFSVMDNTALIYENKYFDCVLDRGNLDSIFTNETMLKVNKTLSEVVRVLKTGGRYICITLSQEHVVKKLLDFFREGWVVRVHKMEQTKEEKAGVTNHFVVFVFVLTKMVSLPGCPPVKVYEYVTDGDHSVRCDSTEDIFHFIQDCQQYTLVRQGLSSIQFEEQIKIDLWSSSSQSEPKYTLRVVDQQKKKTKNGLFAIFIVPQGRETNWLFSTNDGCCQLAESAGFERLVIVTLHRDHTYQGVDKVKEEISSKVVKLQQNGLPKNGKWPVLTLGESVGACTVLHKDSSPFSGDFIVEEVEGDDEEWIRKLVYLSTPYLAQTEISLKPAISSKKRKSKSQKQSKDSATEPQYLSKPANLELDHTHLLFDHHKVIIASLSLINGVNWKRSHLESETVNMLTVGLGGGALPMYMMTCLSPQISQDVVELDPKMLPTACKWFGFKHDELTTSTDAGHDTQLKVHIQNGVDFIMKAAADGIKYNAVIFDVDSKDITIGLSSPPVEFTTLEFLTSVRLILKDGGIFITNLCARNKVMESDAVLSICKVFETVLEIEISSCINKVFVGLPDMWSDVIGLKDVSMLSDKVTDALYRTDI